MHFLGPTLGG